MEKFDTILIIDDDQINNFLFSRIIKLSDISHNIHTELSAKVALRSILQNIETSHKLPDIIFLDINMPVMNGWEFLEEYQKIPKSVRKNIKLYMLSSSVCLEDINKSKEYADVVDYISKPLTKEILFKIHAQHIGGCSYDLIS